ncbi:MAG: M1 family aminopeptidase, partial [Gemmatimonadota bacterium]|nr:M1 family aminopeptidase [Gemmatimonadota bacterium]
RDLARDRAVHLRDLRYDLHFTVPRERSDPILGEARIVFDWEGRRPLAIDFAAGPDAVRGVEANCDVVPYEVVNEHIVLPRAVLRRGENAVRIDFVAGDGSLNRDDEFLYALFVPDRARWAFPAFDQPDLKARFRLALDLPGDWVAVANGAELGATGVSRPGEGERVVYRFAETEPIPTYLFAFAAGRFEIEEAERDGRRMRLFHRETDRAKVSRNLEAIFDLHAAALSWLEAYTGIPYPFGKFDLVAIPSFQYGGMEHPGAIFYRAASLFQDESATQGQLLGRASVIAHETAHMWFGNLVTMEWFDDVWMKEVFANFMAAKIVNPSFPGLDHDLRFLLAHHPAAYAVDRTAGANPIRQPLDNLNEAGSLYGAIIYQKAPIVMRQLELLVGTEPFRDGLREYLDAHRFANATWPELIEILDRRSPLDLEAWSRAWVEEPGRPTMASRLDEAGVDRSGPGSDGSVADRVRVTVRQEDPRGRGLIWAQRLDPWFDRGGISEPLRIEGDEIEITVSGEAAAFEAILPHGGGVGYGLFHPDDRTRAWLLDHLPEIEAAVPRAVAWLTLWDGLLEQSIAPAVWLGTALAAVASEPEELLLTRMLNDLGTAYWRFLPDEDRAVIAPEVERLLWSRIEEAQSTSLKSSLFNAYRSVALTDDAVVRLFGIWRRGGGVSGLPLSENDLTTLAQALAVRGAPDPEEMLDRQAERIENPDRRARFDFVRPALSADPAVRAAFFTSLQDAARREREPWVLEALRFLHHPLRAEASIVHLPAALGLLEEIQRTGDIFFPKRWLDATLGGHGSLEAAGIVRDFLAARPGYPPRLRDKILQSADLLFRASALRGFEPPGEDAGPD